MSHVYLLFVCTDSFIVVRVWRCTTLMIEMLSLRWNEVIMWWRRYQLSNYLDPFIFQIVFNWDLWQPFEIQFYNFGWQQSLEFSWTNSDLRERYINKGQFLFPVNLKVDLCSLKTFNTFHRWSQWRINKYKYTNCFKYSLHKNRIECLTQKV